MHRTSRSARWPGFDAAAFVFLASCLPLLWVDDPGTIREHAAANDASRTMLLIVTAVVMLVLLLAVAAETMGERPQPARPSWC